MGIYFVGMNKVSPAQMIILGAFYFLVSPRNAHAIPPPEVITGIGSSFTQIVSLLVVFLSLGLSFVFHYGKKVSLFLRAKPIIATSIAVGVLGVAFCVVSIAICKYQYEESRYAYEQKVAQELRGVIQEHAGAEGDLIMEAPFFEEHKNLPLTVSNEEFFQVSQGFVLDAREDEEYEIGRYPGSTHIRFADILDGDWRSIPTDSVVYVICWSGIRGEAVASFLRERGILARALEDGAQGWVEDGGLWDGEIAFSEIYRDERYSLVFTTRDVHEYEDRGVVLVDVRQEASREISPIPKSENISSIYTPTEELEAQLLHIAQDRQVITICDDFVSCFDAKIVGIKLEKRGVIFLGRYATPWEYSL